VAPWALLGLGTLRETEGDIDGARAAYARALESSHPDAGLSAGVKLGALLEAAGDEAGAKDAYRAALALQEATRESSLHAK
jgi:Flp pilus assembly protein TadD